jgi:hypothetical protein
MLLESKVCLEGEEEFPKPVPPPFSNRKDSYFPTPSGASPAEKQYISAINDEVICLRVGILTKFNHVNLLGCC